MIVLVVKIFICLLKVGMVRFVGNVLFDLIILSVVFLNFGFLIWFVEVVLLCEL